MLDDDPEKPRIEHFPSRKSAEDDFGNARLTRSLEMRIGILNGENAFQATSRDAKFARTQTPETSHKILLLGLAFYAIAIASLPLLGGENTVAFFFAFLGIFLTVVGDFLRRKTSGRG
ncbi:MAG: hypothetical protein ACE5QW_07085 [Thermoplasmata archaeon]